MNQQNKQVAELLSELELFNLFEAFRLSASYSEHVKAYVIKNKNGAVLAIGENLRLAIRDALAIT